MLLDGLTLVSGSEIQNVHVESGTAFPVSPTQGRIYYLTAPVDGNAIGLYVYNGTTWVTGDITSIVAGTGMTGGGTAGDITLNVDTAIIATAASVTTVSGSLTTHAADASLHLTTSQNTLLDNVTVSSTEVNRLSGVLSNVQTQIDTGMSSLNTHLADQTVHLTPTQNTLLDAVTVTSAEINRLSGVSSNVQTQIDTGMSSLNTHLADQTIHVTSAQNTLLDGLAPTLTADELNYVDGVTSAIQTQIDSKAAASALTTHEADMTVHLTAGQNTLLDGITVTATDLNYTSGLSSNAQTQISSKVNKAGDTMTGNLIISTGSHISITDTPTNGTDAANKAYVDGFTSGLTWEAPVELSNLYGEVATLPGSPAVAEAYYLTTATGGFQIGDIVQWQGGPGWVFIKAAAIGDRFGITIKSGTAGVGTLGTGNHNKIITLTAVGATPTCSVWAPLDAHAFFVRNTNAYLFGHSYVYNLSSTVWVEFSGPNATPAGIGLGYSGNILNINLGAGIAELPTDEVGIDLYPTSGLILTVDGTNSSSNTLAQLAVKLDGATLARSANGMKVAAGSITATEMSANVVGSDMVGGIGVAFNLSTTGVGAGTYKSVTVDTKGRVTAGTNPTTIAGYGITDSQALSTDLTSIAGLVGTAGLLRKTGTGTYSLDTSTYLTANQSITVSGDATGSGTTAIGLTLANSGVSIGTYKSVTVDVKGRVTAGTNPTTIAGYGITDAAPLVVGYTAFTASASQTVFTFSGFTNVVGSHRLMVFVGGVKQLEAAYTETTTNITMSIGLSAGTPVEVYFR